MEILIFAIQTVPFPYFPVPIQAYQPKTLSTCDWVLILKV